MNDAGARSVLAEVRDQAAAAGVLQPPDVTAPLILSASRWTPAQWWQAFEFLFVGSPDIASQHHQHHDDLLFFVPAAPPTANTSTGGAAPELLVRRRGASLPPDLQLSGALFGAVDWCRSLLLNLVLQARFALTVATCSQDRLVDMQDGANLAAAKTHVQKQVYASTTHTVVNLDAASRARAKLPQQSYPDVCFAIHDFEDSFEEIVLTQPDDCYCVLLHAVTQLASTAPPQLPPQQQAANAELRSAADGSASASTASGGGPWATPFRHPLQLPGDGSPITSSHGAACVSPTTQQQQQQHSEWRRKLFGGYLSHLQMNASLNPGHNGGLLDTLVRMAQSHSQHRDCIQLAGPGGVGLLELAVARLYCLPPSPPRPRPPAASGAVVAETATQRQQLEAAGAQMDELAGVDAGWQEVAPPPASAKGAQQGGGGGGGSAGRGGGVLQRAQLLASGVFRGIAQAKAQIQEQRTAVCHFQCALTSLRLPVFAVARTILDSVLAEQDGLTQ